VGKAGPHAFPVIGGTIENPGMDKAVVSLDNSYAMGWFGTLLSNSQTTGAAQPVIDIKNSSHTIGFYNNYCGAANNMNNTYCLQIENSGNPVPDAISAIGLFNGTQYMVHNLINGRTVNHQNKLPFYFYGSASSPGWMDLLVNFTSGIADVEGTAPAAAAGSDICYGDSTAHAVQCSYNGDSFLRAPRVVASGTSTLASGAITQQTCATVVTTAASGAATTDAVQWAFASAPTTNDGLLHYSWYVTAGNVNWQVCNTSAASLASSGLVINWMVIR
jgi:hypothetical protein